MPDPSIVVFVEDEEQDAYFITWAFKKAGLPHRLIHVNDGQEAVNYLGGRDPYSNRTDHPLPHLLLLDLKMPRLGGFEVLAWLHENPELKRIPVIILTSTDYPADVVRANGLGVKEYHVKPSNPQNLITLIQALDNRWLQTPPSRASAVTASAP